MYVPTEHVAHRNGNTVAGGIFVVRGRVGGCVGCNAVVAASTHLKRDIIHTHQRAYCNHLLTHACASP